MNNAELEEELEGYSSIELEYIYETQKDLYSAEEMDYMAKLIDGRKAEERAKVARFLPDEIECPKCGGSNEFQRDICKYCEHEFDKDVYYERAEYLAAGGDPADLEEEELEEGESFLFQYVISFVIPIVGYIMGAILLTKEDEGKRSAGKVCIIAAIISTVLSIAITFALLL